MIARPVGENQRGGGGAQVGEVTRLGGVKKFPCFTCNLTTPPSRGAPSQEVSVR